MRISATCRASEPGSSTSCPEATGHSPTRAAERRRSSIPTARWRGGLVDTLAACSCCALTAMSRRSFRTGILATLFNGSAGGSRSRRSIPWTRGRRAWKRAELSHESLARADETVRSRREGLGCRLHSLSETGPRVDGTLSPGFRTPSLGPHRRHDLYAWGRADAPHLHRRAGAPLPVPRTRLCRRGSNRSRADRDGSGGVEDPRVARTGWGRAGRPPGSQRLSRGCRVGHGGAARVADPAAAPRQRPQAQGAGEPTPADLDRASRSLPARPRGAPVAGVLQDGGLVHEQLRARSVRRSPARK